MPVPALADTGAILALLDKRDPWHVACLDATDELDLPLYTSFAVLAEVFHFVGPDARNIARAWEHIRDNVTVVPMGDTELEGLQRLMAKYHDRPMDLADATLVLLGEN